MGDGGEGLGRENRLTSNLRHDTSCQHSPGLRQAIAPGFQERPRGIEKLMQASGSKDFWAGLLFIGAGTAFAVGAMDFPIGSSARMGPGYFPLMLGILLAITGTFITVGSFAKARSESGATGSLALRPLVFIILANSVFGVLMLGLPQIGLPPFGFIVAIYALILTARLASGTPRLVEDLIGASILAGGCYLLFVVGLKLHIPVWPWFISV